MEVLACPLTLFSSHSFFRLRRSSLRPAGAKPRPPNNQPSIRSTRSCGPRRARAISRVKAAIDKGAAVDAKARYDMTALAFAADKGHLEVVKFLIEKGADVNVQDTFYKARPIVWALSNKHLAVATLLLERDPLGAAFAMSTGIQSGNEGAGEARARGAGPHAGTGDLRHHHRERSQEAPAMLALLEAKLATMPKASTVTIAPGGAAVLRRPLSQPRATA